MGVQVKPRPSRRPVLYAALALAAVAAVAGPLQPFLQRTLLSTPTNPEGSDALIQLATYEQRMASQPVTDTLWQRMPQAVIDEDRKSASICPDCPRRDYPNGVHVEYKRHLIATALRAANLSEVLQLSTAEPPEDTHAMSRGIGFVTGGLYESDLITSAIQVATGEEFGGRQRAVLDFGGSTGRVLRAMQAAYPANTYHLCDPNRKSILWARKHIPRVNAFVNPDAPPLPLEAGSLDLVYAVSIWSHYAERLARLWLDEMYRILKPGGLLYITTHGFQAVRYYANHDSIPPDNLAEVTVDLKTRGFHFDNFFGAKGDWGVVNAEWGHAYLSPAWLEAAAGWKFRIAYFCVGCEQDNQDVWVLVRL